MRIVTQKQLVSVTYSSLSSPLPQLKRLSEMLSAPWGTRSHRPHQQGETQDLLRASLTRKPHCCRVRSAGCRLASPLRNTGIRLAVIKEDAKSERVADLSSQRPPRARGNQPSFCHFPDVKAHIVWKCDRAQGPVLNTGTLRGTSALATISNCITTHAPQGQQHVWLQFMSVAVNCQVYKCLMQASFLSRSGI